MIQAGADLNSIGGKGTTPLMAVAENFSFDCVAALLKAGAELDTTYMAFLAMITSAIQLPNSEGRIRNTHYQKHVKRKE